MDMSDLYLLNDQRNCEILQFAADIQECLKMQIYVGIHVKRQKHKITWQ